MSVFTKRCVQCTLIRCASAVIFVVVAFRGVSASQTNSSLAPLHPTRSISLKACGWEPEPSIVHHTGFVPLRIAFDHQGNLWTGYSKKLIELTPRSAPETAFEYEIVAISGSPAQCALRLRRPTTANSPAAVLVSSKDGLLVVANDELHLVDEVGFKDSAAFELMRPPDHARYRVIQSPGRKFLVVVVEGFTRADSSYTWLDPDSLVVRNSCTYPPAPDNFHYIGLRSFADDGRFLELDYGWSRFGHSLTAGQFCSPRREVPPEHIQPKDAILLESETAYLIQDPRREKPWRILIKDRSEATVLDLIGGSNKETIGGGNVAVSEDERRLALSIDTLAGGSQILDISSHVASRRVDVYDTKTWACVAQIKLLTPGEASLSFSPDGKTLAIQTEDLVQFYDGIP
jgi:hypothetical protein